MLSNVDASIYIAKSLVVVVEIKISCKTTLQICTHIGSMHQWWCTYEILELLSFCLNIGTRGPVYDHLNSCATVCTAMLVTSSTQMPVCYLIVHLHHMSHAGFVDHENLDPTKHKDTQCHTVLVASALTGHFLELSVL